MIAGSKASSKVLRVPPGAPALTSHHHIARQSGGNRAVLPPPGSRLSCSGASTRAQVLHIHHLGPVTRLGPADKARTSPKREARPTDFDYKGKARSSSSKCCITKSSDLTEYPLSIANRQREDLQNSQGDPSLECPPETRNAETPAMVSQSRCLVELSRDVYGFVRPLDENIILWMRTARIRSGFREVVPDAFSIALVQAYSASHAVPNL